MSSHHLNQESQLDLFDWHPKFSSCLGHFLDHAQHTSHVQTVAAFVNIKLPYQRTTVAGPALGPLRMASTPASALASGVTAAPAPEPSSDGFKGSPLSAGTLVVPYIRRLVATGFDSAAVLHSFFGDDWSDGVGPIHEAERRNYLFAAKSDTWLKVKANYDMADGQVIPFLRPLQDVTEKEIQAAESNWSEWLAMQDWMLGPRAPVASDDSTNQRMTGAQD